MSGDLSLAAGWKVKWTLSRKKICKENVAELKAIPSKQVKLAVSSILVLI